MKPIIDNTTNRNLEAGRDLHARPTTAELFDGMIDEIREHLVKIFIEFLTILFIFVFLLSGIPFKLLKNFIGL